jgi:hypothetical protein
VAKWLFLCMAVGSGLSRGVQASVMLAFVDAGQRLAVSRATDGAARRLATPGCRLLLNDFTNAAGQALEAAQAAAPTTLLQQLAALRFIDGRDAALCRTGPTLAFTVPGARVVHVCGRRFRERYDADRTGVEIIVIHEFLHTLGLGENPPSSDAITMQVAKRCAS